MARKTKTEDAEEPKSLLLATDTAWRMSPLATFRAASLWEHVQDYITAEDPKCPGRTIAEGFVVDLFALARAGNSTAINQIADRFMGKTADVNINANVVFDDNERRDRLLEILGRKPTTGSPGEAEPSTEGGD